MFTRSRIALLGVVMLALAGCGSPAVNVTHEPTRVISTRVPLIVTAADGSPVPTSVAIQPTATRTLVPTEAPTQPPAATATRRSFATATPNVTAIPGNAQNGEALFTNGTGDAAIPTCVTCHNVVDDGTIKLGPLMAGIGTRAETRVSGEDAYTYLHQSIVEPNAYLVPNEDNKVYSAAGTSIMFQDYGKLLTPEQIDDLVAYLLSLK
jgi:cytochrome c2